MHKFGNDGERKPLGAEFYLLRGRTGIGCTRFAARNVRRPASSDLGNNFGRSMHSIRSAICRFCNLRSFNAPWHGHFGPRSPKRNLRNVGRLILSCTEADPVLGPKEPCQGTFRLPGGRFSWATIPSLGPGPLVRVAARAARES